MEILEIIELLKRYKNKEIYEIGSVEGIKIMIDAIENDIPIHINTRNNDHEYLINIQDSWCSCSKEYICCIYDYYENDITEEIQAEEKAMKETYISLNHDLL